MKNYVRTAIDTLIALDFQLDHEDRKLRGDRYIFTHANAPDDRLILNLHMSEPAARTVVQKARVVVGLATSDSLKKVNKARVNAREKAERVQRNKDAEAARQLAAARRDREQAQKAAAAVERRRKELDNLLRGKSRPSRVDARSLDPDGMFTAEEIADATGLTDKAVALAINTGALEAYMCADKKARAKGADVLAWMKHKVA